MSWKVTMAGPATRALVDELPEAVAAAVLDFAAGPLADDPRRVGRPLRGGRAGAWTARRGSWRIVYELDERSRTVTIVCIGHRATIYRHRGDGLLSGRANRYVGSTVRHGAYGTRVQPG